MKIRLYSLIGLAAILLAACSSAPVVGPVNTGAREAEAVAAVAAGDLTRAQAMYRTLVEQAQGGQRARFQIALAEVEVGLGMAETALMLLDSIRLPVPENLVADFSAVRAQAFFALGRTVDAVRLLVEREIWLESGAEILDNQARIWDGLGEPASQTTATLRTGDPTIDGWLALAPLTRLTDDNTQFRGALSVWLAEFGTHPAGGGILAEQLATLRGDGDRPTKVALLLPLSSSVRASAEAVLEGFFAAYFNSRLAGQIALQVYDTAQRGSAESFVTAQLESADFVVGPLLAEEVQLVQNQAGFVPTLALNLGNPTALATTNFFQFALASDDEVEAIAAKGIADGHKTAVVLFASTDRGYGQRDRFVQAWESRGGQVINAVAYVPGSDNLSAPIEQLLNISQSEARHERLEANLGRTVELQPRRRADIDMIFLQIEPSGGNALARLLVPLLGDNDADPADIPTFATRDVYDPTRRGGDPDLDGLMFPDVPLLVNPAGSGRAAADRLAEFSTTSASQNPRLFAFGFDAYQLVETLFSRADAAWPLSGATGELWLDDSGRIRRVLPFAQFRGGIPQPLAPTIGTAAPR